MISINACLFFLFDARHFKQVWTGVIKDLEISGEKQNNLLEYSTGKQVHWEQVKVYIG